MRGMHGLSWEKGSSKVIRGVLSLHELKIVSYSFISHRCDYVYKVPKVWKSHWSPLFQFLFGRESEIDGKALNNLEA